MDRNSLTATLCNSVYSLIRHGHRESARKVLELAYLQHTGGFRISTVSEYDGHMLYQQETGRGFNWDGDGQFSSTQTDGVTGKQFQLAEAAVQNYFQDLLVNEEIEGLPHKLRTACEQFTEYLWPKGPV